MNPKPDSSFKSDSLPNNSTETQDIASGVNQLSLTQTSSSSIPRSGDFMDSAVDMIIVSGLSGSGIQSIGYQLYSRLKKAFTGTISAGRDSPGVNLCQLDIALIVSESESSSGSFNIEDIISKSVRESTFDGSKSSNNCSCILVVILIYSPVFHIRHSDLLNFVTSSLENVSIAQLISVISSGSSKLSVPVIRTPRY